MDDREYTPENLRYFEQELEHIYHDILCMGEDGADAESGQFLLLALASLDMARRHLSIAAMKQARASTVTAAVQVFQTERE